MASPANCTIKPNQAIVNGRYLEKFQSHASEILHTSCIITLCAVCEFELILDCFVKKNGSPT